MYLYSFFVVGVAFISLWVTYINIQDLVVESIEIDDVFAQEKAFATVTILNPRKSTCRFVEVLYLKDAPLVIEEIEAGASVRVRIPLGEFSRGQQSLQGITLQSSFPFLLQRSWRRMKVDKIFFVFPKREGKPGLPYLTHHSQADEGRKVDSVRTPDAEFSGHRRYESSDSSRHIDWKAYARTEKLLVKDYQGYRPQEIRILWQQTVHLSEFEARLSQMALWVEVAQAKGFHYSFELGKISRPAHRSQSHYLQCLRSLAEARPEELL